MEISIFDVEQFLERAPTGEDPVIFFDADADQEERIVYLTHMETQTRVKNTTDYVNKPRYNWFWNAVDGDIEWVESESLEDFLSMIDTPKLRELSFNYSASIRQAPKPNKKENETYNIKDKFDLNGMNVCANLDSLFGRVTSNPDNRFIIDPRSHFRIEMRISEGESRLYRAMLNYTIMASVKDMPPMNAYVRNVVRAKLIR